MEPEAATPEPCFLRSERSPAFARYCERVYGRMLNQYGTADMEQLDLLVRVLGLGPGSRALDAGCGTGITTAYLAETTGADFTGIDSSEVAIRRARQLAEAGPHRLRFEVGTMDALGLPAASFDAVIAIESLYFPKDLPGTIGQFKILLRPGGQMGLFFTHLGPASAVSPDQTKLGQALQANGIAFQAHALTDQDRRFWQRSRDAAEALRAEFDAEGNFDLAHLGETTAVLDLIGKGGHARHLYHARLP